MNLKYVQLYTMIVSEINIHKILYPIFFNFLGNPLPADLFYANLVVITIHEGASSLRDFRPTF